MTQPTKVMTAAANGIPYEAYREANWSDEQLIAAGLMEPRAQGHDTASDDRLRLLIERVERLEEERKAKPRLNRKVKGGI